MGATLAGVLGRYGAAYLREHTLSTAQARVWRAIEACRTPAMGGRHQQCDGCGREQWLFNSCRNRHCPQCQSSARDAWRQARLAELLPVPYCHLVFTLPHALNALARWHPHWVYRTLMHCTAATLTEFAANARWLGARGAFTLMLHTWKQDLGLHLHVHAVMACGGLDEQGHWVAPKRSPSFLFPVHALSGVFRAKFIQALRRAEDGGELERDPSNTAKARQARLQQLSRHDWVVYAKTPLAGPEVVLDYLSRYTHRVAVSNERILGMDAHGVRLSVRQNVAHNVGADHRPGKRVITIDGPEFIGRFLQHVLPVGFKRIRHYGLLSPALKTKRMARARAELKLPQPSAPAREDAAEFLQRVARIDALRCPHCALGKWRTLATLQPAYAAKAQGQAPCTGPP